MKSTLRTTKEGLVSVVVAFFNAERFLAEAIESVLVQTYAHWELKLVDDGSTDSGPEIALKYQAQNPGRIHYLTHPDHKNLGMCTTRNLGVRHSKGEYIAVLDSDDVWFPFKLEQQVALMQTHPNVGFVYGHSEYWYDWDSHKRHYGCNHIPALAPSGRVYIPPELLKICNQLGEIGTPCPSDFLLRREVVDRVAGFEEAFDPEHQEYEDQAFLAKVYLNAPVFVAAECWDRYRIHNDSWCAVSQKLGRSKASRRFFFSWLERYLRDNDIRDREIWRMYWRRTRSYRHPQLAALARSIRSIAQASCKLYCRQLQSRTREDE